MLDFAWHFLIGSLFQAQQEADGELEGLSQVTKAAYSSGV